jgi:hypothetical protein
MAGLINRRIFLRGLGGACVAAPFLGTLSGRGVKAADAVAPKRLIVMFTHYGCITSRFFPDTSHGALTASDLESTTLKHLAPYVDKLLMPRGIRAMNEWNATMTRGQGNDPHTQVVGSYFTCQPVTPNSNDPFSFDTATKFNAKPVGPSLDHVIAKQLSAGGTPLFIRVGNQNDSPQSGISYSAAETAYSGLGTPSQILGTLTGLFQGGDPTPDSYAAARGKSILDLVKDDLDTLERFDMSESDARKLEAWKDLLHETAGSIGSAQCNGNTASLLGATEEHADAAMATPAEGYDRLTNKITSTLDVADIYSNLAALAAVCQANPVIFLKYPGSFVFKGLGITIETASLSHRIGNAGLSGTCVSGVLDMIRTIDDYYARKFAHLVGVLDGIEEGDGTVLDNSAAVWFQEMSDGLAQNLNNLPIVQVGSAGGYFRTGCAVNVEDGSPTLVKGNSESACTPDTTDMVNGIDQSTGTDAKYANAPINKYYVTLMNALGVKAGPDGFPLAGGAEPVTKFGMYDRTEDFVGGGSNPPMIHSPGEYAALRA